MKVALLSNVTVSVLKTLLSETVDVWVPPGFGALVETALSPPEEMYALFFFSLTASLQERRL